MTATEFNLGILRECDLSTITNSRLEGLGYTSARTRMRILRAISTELGTGLPTGIQYVFDVDGTLTPHQGEDQDSLWHCTAAEYYERASVELRDRTAALLAMLPEQSIFISRNLETTVCEFFSYFDPDFCGRANLAASSFRKTGRHPTAVSKICALRGLKALRVPTIYVDDAQREIQLCARIAPAWVFGYHIATWLGSRSSFEELRAYALGIQSNPPVISDSLSASTDSDSGYLSRSDSPIAGFGRSSMNSPNRMETGLSILDQSRLSPVHEPSFYPESTAESSGQYVCFI